MHGAWIYYPRVPRLMRDDRRRISSRCVRNRNSSCTTSLDHTRYKTLPAHTPDGPTRYKTLPAHPARRPTRYKTLPARPKTLFLAHFAPAGRVLSRFRHQHDERGEKSHAPTPHLTPPRRPSPNFACNSTTQVTQHHELTHTSMMLAGNCMRISVRAPRLAAFMTPTCRRERTRPQHRNKTLPTTRLLRLTAK